MNDIIVRALRESFSHADLIAMRAQASKDMLSGLTVTSVSMSTSSFSGTITRKPEELLALIQPLIEDKDGRPVTEQPMARPVCFARKFVTT